MDFDLTLNLDPMSYMPQGPMGWALQIIPAAFGIWAERSDRRLARVSYLCALVLRLIGLVILGWGVLGIMTAIFDAPNMSDFLNPTQYEGFWPLTITGNVLAAIFGIVMVRPLVWRLRDAGIDKKWAYFAVLPYLDFLMFVGLIFLPPSKQQADTPAPAVPLV